MDSVRQVTNRFSLDQSGSCGVKGSTFSRQGARPTIIILMALSVLSNQFVWCWLLAGRGQLRGECQFSGALLVVSTKM